MTNNDLKEAFEATDNDLMLADQGLMDCLQVLMGQQANGEVDQQVLADCVKGRLNRKLVGSKMILILP